MTAPSPTSKDALLAALALFLLLTAPVRGLAASEVRVFAAASTDARSAATQRPRPGSLRARSGTTTPSGPATKRIRSSGERSTRVAAHSRRDPSGSTPSNRSIDR